MYTVWLTMCVHAFVRACMCIWLLSITLQGNLSPWTLCIAKVQKKLCHCQALTWTALQRTSLRAAILERLAWAEIAAWEPEILCQLQTNPPLENGGGWSRARHSSIFTVCPGLKILRVLGMFPVILNQFIETKFPLDLKFFLFVLQHSKNESGNAEEE